MPSETRIVFLWCLRLECFSRFLFLFFAIDFFQSVFKSFFFHFPSSPQLSAKIAANEGGVQQALAPQQQPVIQQHNAATNVTKSTLSNFLSVNGIGSNLQEPVAVVEEQPVKEEVAPVHVHGTLMCSLPGCDQVGSFVCSACGKAGYCGAEHQRDHWGSHIHECSV
jgi:hypothetical protein